MHRLPFLSHSDVTSPHRYDEPLPRLLEARRTRRTAEANASLRTSDIRVRNARQYSSLRFVCVMHGSGAQPPMPSRPFHHTKQDNAAGLVTPPCPASQASARALTVRTAGGCYWSGELMLLLDSSGTSHQRRFVRLRRSPVARPFEHNALAAAGLCYLHCSMPTAILLGF
jgi:hypothetical protein